MVGVADVAVCAGVAAALRGARGGGGGGGLGGGARLPRPLGGPPRAGRGHGPPHAEVLHLAELGTQRRGLARPGGLLAAAGVLAVGGGGGGGHAAAAAARLQLLVGAGGLGLGGLRVASAQRGLQHGVAPRRGLGSELGQARGGVVQVDGVRGAEVGAHGGQARPRAAAQLARALPGGGGRGDVLILEMGVHGDVTLEPFFTRWAHERQRFGGGAFLLLDLDRDHVNVLPCDPIVSCLVAELL